MYVPQKPSELVLVRHGESEGNIRLDALMEDTRYQMFIEIYKTYPLGKKFPLSIRRLARKLISDYRVDKKPDHSLELTQVGIEQSRQTGIKLRELIEPPHVVYVSPYMRTLQTLECLENAWTELRSAKIIKTDALREQQFGIAEQYVYHNLYFAFHPLHRAEYLADEFAKYYYQFEGGDSIARLRERVGAWLERVEEIYAGKRVLVISHSGTKFATIAELEGWDFRQYVQTYKQGMFHNCGTTIYRANSAWDEEHSMKCDKEREYNMKLWNIE